MSLRAFRFTLPAVAAVLASCTESAGFAYTSFSAFVVDRPFVVAIRERLSGTVLFMGLIGDPTAEEGGPARSPSRDDC
jgi:serine protease inhibitor